jgi:transcriptional regulator NrdR family protein
MLFVLSTTRVTNSRFFKRQNTVWRRRQTLDGVVFTTRETLDYEQITVIKKSGLSTGYKPGKLYISLLKACDHIKESEDVAWQIKNTVEEKLVALLDENLTITTQALAEVSIQTLKLFNTTAYVKYASYQPEIVSARKLAATVGS